MPRELSALAYLLPSKNYLLDSPQIYKYNTFIENSTSLHTSSYAFDCISNINFFNTNTDSTINITPFDINKNHFIDIDSTSKNNTISFRILLKRIISSGFSLIKMNINLHPPVGSIKPVIYYNGKFHLVEEDTAAKFHFDTDYALFQIYNLKGSKNDFIEAITDLAGPSSTISFLNDFVRVFTRNLESKIELRAGSVNNTLDPNRLKIKIKFSNKSHADLVDFLANSSKIASLTLNGFTDWIPLDSTSYESLIKSEEERQNSILRALGDTIDPIVLDVAIDDLLDDFATGAFEKLFPGPILNINRDSKKNNGKVVMTTVITRGRYSFDESMGKIFIEILNALIQDRRLEKNFDEHTYDSYFLLVVRLLNLIRDLVHLNEIYEDFHSPRMCPLFSNSIKYMKVKYVESLTDLEKALIDIGFEKFEDRLQELTMIVREIDRNVEASYRNIQMDVEKWEKQKKMVNFFYILSIFVTIALPVSYHYYRQLPFKFIMTVIGISISLLSALWNGWSKNNYSKAIKTHKKAISIHAATANSLEALQRWLNRISIVKTYKVPINNEELNVRKTVLMYLFDELVSTSAEIRLSIGLEDELRKYR
ncbi:11690_t:CDS:2 [Diversispora eburnea]|uniref:11690_t:CDS:1 n=1 Tax=Diversispora eburnea TaxID=1213867 RepID=A0A9N9ASI8_9GLOM|nr:11690_t:CDS:2 [Diversispora eburnea]